MHVYRSRTPLSKTRSFPTKAYSRAQVSKFRSRSALYRSSSYSKQRRPTPVTRSYGRSLYTVPKYSASRSIRKPLKKQWAAKTSKRHRKLVGSTGQNINVQSEWDYENVTCSVNLPQDTYGTAVVANNGVGYWGLGINLSPTIPGQGEAQASTTSSVYYLMRSYGPANDFRFNAYRRLYEYYALKAVSVKLTPLAGRMGGAP